MRVEGLPSCGKILDFKVPGSEKVTQDWSGLCLGAQREPRGSLIGIPSCLGEVPARMGLRMSPGAGQRQVYHSHYRGKAFGKQIFANQGARRAPKNHSLSSAFQVKVFVDQGPHFATLDHLRSPL